MATSKETRVRVEGFSKISATVRPWRVVRGRRSALCRSAPSSRATSSSGVTSSTERKSRLLMDAPVDGTAGQRLDPRGQSDDVKKLLEDGLRAELATERSEHLGDADHHQHREQQRAIRAAQAPDDV